MQQPRPEAQSEWSISLDFVRDGQMADPLVNKLRKWVEDQPPQQEELVNETDALKSWYFMRDQLIMRNEVLYRRHPQGPLQIVIPTALKSQFLELIHKGLDGSHLGQT